MRVADCNRSHATSWLRLLLACAVPPHKINALLQSFGKPEAVLACTRSDLRALLTDDEAQALLRSPSPGILEAAWRWLDRADAHLVVQHDVEYPPLWREMADAPCAVFAQGRVADLARPSLAIVGSRNATPQGLRDAYRLARELSDAGLVIVSGLARGIDCAAHRGGLEGAAAASIAVMGTGPDITYPRTHVPLREEIARRGCVVSEFAPGMPPLPLNFPRRNRLISGLACGVLVVEAAQKSGSLGTAFQALQQNRDVFAVPGSIHSPLAKGCHLLIKRGAILVEEAADVLRALGIELPAAGSREASNPAVAHRDPTLAAMGFAPVSLEHLAQRMRLDAATLAALMSRLEIAGAVEVLPGGWYQRVEKRVIE